MEIMEDDIQKHDADDELKEIVSIQSEASILQKASDTLSKLVESKSKVNNFSTTEIGKSESNVILTEQDSGLSILKAKLLNQVCTGEITPFQASKKETECKNNLGKTFKESTQLLDLEKYIFRQAELARKKKLLKRNKELQKQGSKNEVQNDAVPAKKARLIGENNSVKKNAKKSETITLQTQVSTANVGSLSEDNVTKENENNCDKDNIMYMESTSETSNTLIFEQITKARRTFDTLEEVDESGSEYVPSDDYDSDTEENIKKVSKKKKNNSMNQSIPHRKRVLDDGNEDIYRERVENSGYKKKEALHKVDNLFKVPIRIWKQLYKYQRVSVKWLWELHTRNLGGLLGEMGLGKTVQIIAFLAGLDCSELLTDGGRFRGLGPTLIICPATLLEQWIKHFHDWCPTFRAVMLHHSGTFQGDIGELLHSLKGGGILVTSYSGIIIHRDPLLKFKWHYVILDEGHKIRNPEAKVTKIVKGFLTPHRLLLTGSPMQNSLKELWSLFDFILPGKLGTLPAFMEHCAGPITRGGYSNATSLQEATALQVATMLKNAITPYMLRRTKYDVQHHVSLPDKNEQVLFCSLTEEQRELYKQFLRSDDVSYVLHDRREGGRYRARLLVALTAFRKICNHPDLYLYSDNQMTSDEEEDLQINENEINKFGHWKRSGKMTVVRSLLKIWKKQGHRVLLFTQSRQMLHILEGLVQKEKYEYLRMDGTTPMGQRQAIISRFNRDSRFFVFLLTTRVGGLGVNLTGANRVVIYDPDWNPATDAQARERAWRIGQEKNVTVYRLITAGTIEEKMYHRQVFKILLSNRVLEDPKQRRLFRTSDLAELFNLNEPISGGSESDQLFKKSKLLPIQPNFTSSQIEAMKKLASTLSKKIGEQTQAIKLHKNNVNKNANLSNNTSDTKLDSLSNVSLESSDSDGNKNTSNNYVQSNEVKESNTSILNTCLNNEKNNTNLVEKEIQNSVNLQESKSCNESLIFDTEDNKEIITTDLSNTEDLKNLTKEENELEEGEICDDSCSKQIPKPPAIDKTIAKESKSNKLHRKHKKHKKIKSENEISAIFEGERVSCLIGRRLGTSKVSEPVPTEDDQYVLSKLFSKAAVSSAFQHESVLSNAVLHPDDETPLQRAAKENASEKMDCVRQSRKWCWMPSWDKPPEEDYDDND